MQPKLYLGVVLVAFAIAASACSDDDEGKSSGPNSRGDGGGPDAAEPEPQSNEDGTDPRPKLADDVALPIVFVHGFSGSSQQFTSQAWRFVANGYPEERLSAFEHDGAGMDIPGFVAGADKMIDEVRARFGTDKVFLIGHSRGTSVSSSYLSDAGRAAKVAKYIALDGAGCASITVPCISPAQTTNTRAGQTHPIPGQKHVEVATSKESFAIQWEFLFGKAPEVLDIVKQRAPVQISGRAVNSPANTGREGTHLEVWELNSETGLRAKDEPLAKYDIDDSGDWGPVTVDPEKHYEMVLIADDSKFQHHFYEQPFLRSSKFIRLRSGPPDSPARMHTNTGDHHAAIHVSRMREWTTEDTLEIGTKSKSGNQDPRNVLSEATGNTRISIALHDDAATPGETTVAMLPWFPEQAFQTGLDIFMPANDKPDGTITIKNNPRGDTSKPQTIHIANWASTNHQVTVLLSDFPRD